METGSIKCKINLYLKTKIKIFYTKDVCTQMFFVLFILNNFIYTVILFSHANILNIDMQHITHQQSLFTYETRNQLFFFLNRQDGLSRMLSFLDKTYIIYSDIDSLRTTDSNHLSVTQIVAENNYQKVVDETSI